MAHGSCDHNLYMTEHTYNGILQWLIPMWDKYFNSLKHTPDKIKINITVSRMTKKYIFIYLIFFLNHAKSLYSEMKMPTNGKRANPFYSVHKPSIFWLFIFISYFQMFHIKKREILQIRDILLFHFKFLLFLLLSHWFYFLCL